MFDESKLVPFPEPRSVMNRRPPFHSSLACESATAASSILTSAPFPLPTTNASLFTSVLTSLLFFPSAGARTTLLAAVVTVRSALLPMEGLCDSRTGASRRPRRHDAGAATLDVVAHESIAAGNDKVCLHKIEATAKLQCDAGESVRVLREARLSQMMNVGPATRWSLRFVARRLK